MTTTNLDQQTSTRHLPMTVPIPACQMARVAHSQIDPHPPCPLTQAHEELQ